MNHSRLQECHYYDGTENSSTYLKDGFLAYMFWEAEYAYVNFDEDIIADSISLYKSVVLDGDEQELPIALRACIFEMFCRYSDIAPDVEAENFRRKRVLDSYLKEYLYIDWVNRVSVFLEKTAPNLGVGGRCCSVLQSRAILGKDVDVVYLGCNADENYGYCGVDRQRFWSGNPFFYNNEKHHNNDAMFHRPWCIWYKLYGALNWLKCTTPMDDGHYVFMNAIYFGTKSLGQLNKLLCTQEAANKCLSFTDEVIHKIFNPKLIVCFSVKDCFDRLDSTFRFQNVETLHPKHPNPEYHCKNAVKTGEWNGIRVIGIPHSSQAISYNELGGVANFLLEQFNIATRLEPPKSSLIGW